MILVRLFGLLVVLTLLVAMYWSPTLVAFGRRARHRAVIAGLNTLFGWTIVGWLALLAWALAAHAEPEGLPLAPARPLRDYCSRIAFPRARALFAGILPTKLARS